MSYCFNIQFKKVEDEEVVPILNFVTRRFINKEIARKYFEDNFLGIIKRLNEVNLKNKEEIIDLKNIFIVELALQKVLTFEFCYRKKEKLLGYIGDYDIKLGNTRSICFQNMCDQDYDYETFTGLSENIDNIIKRVKKMTKEEIIKKRGDFYGDIYKSKNLEYYQKVELYDELFEDVFNFDVFLKNDYFSKDVANKFYISIGVPLSIIQNSLYFEFIKLAKEKLKC